MCQTTVAGREISHSSRCRCCLVFWERAFADRCSKTVFGPALRVAQSGAYTGRAPCAAEAVTRRWHPSGSRSRPSRSARSPGPGRIRIPNDGGSLSISLPSLVLSHTYVRICIYLLVVLFIYNSFTVIYIIDWIYRAYAYTLHRVYRLFLAALMYGYLSLK